MKKEEMAKAYAEGFAKEYKEIAYDAFLCGYGAKCSTETPKDLEEAAEISFDEASALTEGYMYFLAKGLKENHPRPIGPHWFCEYAKNRFIAGAKWQKEKDNEVADKALTTSIKLQEGWYAKGIADGEKSMKEQMMKEAVEGVVVSELGAVSLPRCVYEKYDGQKVRIIVLPKED